ncbi:MAG: hypothetical protein RIQ52_1710, partial [Pseudomonadota bacterium]
MHSKSHRNIQFALVQQPCGG